MVPSGDPPDEVLPWEVLAVCAGTCHRNRSNLSWPNNDSPKEVSIVPQAILHLLLRTFFNVFPLIDVLQKAMPRPCSHTCCTTDLHPPSKVHSGPELAPAHIFVPHRCSVNRVSWFFRQPSPLASFTPCRIILALHSLCRSALTCVKDGHTPNRRV